MNDYRAVLKRTGLVLIAIGSVDIGYMILCIANGMSYQSSLNIFAVVAGHLLIMGSLKTARAVTSLAAFLFSGGIGAVVLLLIPMLIRAAPPADLWLLELKRDPIATVSYRGAHCFTRHP